MIKGSFFFFFTFLFIIFLGFLTFSYFFDIFLPFYFLTYYVNVWCCFIFFVVCIFSPQYRQKRQKTIVIECFKNKFRHKQKTLQNIIKASRRHCKNLRTTWIWGHLQHAVYIAVSFYFMTTLKLTIYGWTLRKTYDNIFYPLQKIFFIVKFLATNTYCCEK